ncbi:MAG: hypothetical protein HY543_03520, partial [Deltaproteobacteria bacterium]|nr:hypothetical protein [Deltaproteobacteria bacterium]
MATMYRIQRITTGQAGGGAERMTAARLTPRTGRVFSAADAAAPAVAARDRIAGPAPSAVSAWPAAGLRRFGTMRLIGSLSPTSSGDPPTRPDGQADLLAAAMGDPAASSRSAVSAADVRKIASLRAAFRGLPPILVSRLIARHPFKGEAMWYFLQTLRSALRGSRTTVAKLNHVIAATWPDAPVGRRRTLRDAALAILFDQFLPGKHWGAPLRLQAAAIVLQAREQGLFTDHGALDPVVVMLWARFRNLPIDCIAAIVAGKGATQPPGRRSTSLSSVSAQALQKPARNMEQLTLGLAQILPSDAAERHAVLAGVGRWMAEQYAARSADARAKNYLTARRLEIEAARILAERMAADGRIEAEVLPRTMARL